MGSDHARVHMLLRASTRDVIPGTGDTLTASRLKLLEITALAVMHELQARHGVPCFEAGATVAMMLECWQRTNSVAAVLRESDASASSEGGLIREVMMSLARIELATLQKGSRNVRSFAERLRLADETLDELTARRTAEALQADLLELRRELMEPA